MMDKTIVISIVEFISGLILEGIILGFIFQMISNKSQEKQQTKLQNEMYRIESQNRHNTQLIMDDLKEVKDSIIHEVNELLP